MVSYSCSNKFLNIADDLKNSRTLRRLASDHGALRSQSLPPNYLFPPGTSDTDDLTELDILLAGPTHTPFARGVWKLHLSIPSNYPQQPPTANFRTAIFHPNVDPQTGGVCVETLKRDWDSKLTLRDVLVTISCLLIQPNPDSALNAEAGALIQDNYEAFARRAELMTSIHAVVPKALQTAVKEAQERGRESSEEEAPKEEGSVTRPEAPLRRRKQTARQRGAAVSRRSEGSPSAGLARRRQQGGPSQPFVVQTSNDDVFGATRPQLEPTRSSEDDDSSMIDINQENDESKSPVKASTPKVATPKRPLGMAIPLGELTMDEALSDTEEDDTMDAEYPPSPKKSPTKSPAKQKQKRVDVFEHAESSRDATARASDITPPNNLIIKTLAQDSPFASMTDLTPSPRKERQSRLAPSQRAPLFPSLGTPRNNGGIFKTKTPSSSEKKRQEQKRKAELDAKLWDLCGRDIGRWNRGEFDGEPFKMKAKRW